MGLGKLIRRGRGTLGGLPPCEGVRCPTVGLWWALCRGEDGRCRGAVFCWDVVFFSHGDDSVVEDFVVMYHSRVSTSIPIGNRPFASSPRPQKEPRLGRGRSFSSDRSGLEADPLIRFLDPTLHDGLEVARASIASQLLMGFRGWMSLSLSPFRPVHNYEDEKLMPDGPLNNNKYVLGALPCSECRPSIF